VRLGQAWFQVGRPVGARVAWMQECGGNFLGSGDKVATAV